MIDLAAVPLVFEPIESVGFVPHGDWVVVKRDPWPTSTPSGLVHLAERPFEWVCTGVVQAVGPGARSRRGIRVPVAVRVGERVVYDYRPSKEDLAMRCLYGDRAILLRETELVAVMESDA